MKNEDNFYKVQKIIEALVENDRYSLIMCINKYKQEITPDCDLMNLSFKPKKYLRETIKTIAFKILESENFNKK